MTIARYHNLHHFPNPAPRAEPLSHEHMNDAQNVANVNTPGYRKLSVSFDETLAAQFDQHGDKRIRGMQPEIFEDDSSPDRLDGNNVDIDREMMRLNKNTLLNNTFLQIISSKAAMMRRAVNGQ